MITLTSFKDDCKIKINPDQIITLVPQPDDSTIVTTIIHNDEDSLIVYEPVASILDIIDKEKKRQRHEW
jgi:hypothetical protein